MKKNNFSSIDKILLTSKKGGMYILVDDENRENEGDLIFCSSDVTPKKINFMAKLFWEVTMSTLPDSKIGISKISTKYMFSLLI